MPSKINRPYRKNYRFSALTARQINTLCEMHGVSETQLIENLIAKEYGEMEQNMSYRLDIYTWPTMQGVNPGVRTTYHLSPQDAKLTVDNQDQSFYCAALLVKVYDGYAPCDWNGKEVGGSNTWPTIQGPNKSHPAYTAMMNDWQNMIDLAVAENNRTNEPMIEIANRILSERHPKVSGFVEKLALKAADESLRQARIDLG